MIRARHHGRTGITSVIGALLLYAVVIRALIPAALMLERDADSGRLAIVLCSAQLGISALYDPAAGVLRDDTGLAGHAGQDDHTSAQHQADCPFALAAMPAMPSADTVLPAVPLVLAAMLPLQAVAATVSAHALPPLPPRGPPALV